VQLPRSVTPWAVALLGAFLVIGGFVAAATVGPVSYGWFAYEPLPASTSEVSTMTVLGPRRSWALAVCGLGALLLSGALGYVMGTGAA
jgi:hypothetical protein